MKKVNIIEVIRYVLAIMLILNFTLSLVPILINSEAWFFRHKLGGIKASCWLLTNGVIGLVLGYSLLIDLKYSFLAVFLFFAANFVNVMMIPLKGLAYPPFYSLGLILSLIGVVSEVRK